jgi:hypothetical protein
MTDLSRDPILRVVQGEMRRGIRVALENGCLAAAVILVLSGIDSMAYVGMPAAQDDVTGADFVGWADAYIRFPCKEQLPGIDLYGARCSMLHSYGTASRLSRGRKCRQVGYTNESRPEVQFNPSASTQLVLVSVPALATAFFQGTDRFLIDIFADPAKASLAEERFKKLVQTMQVARK